MVVIIDTNILRADFLFESEKYRQFLNALYRSKTTLIIPQIVLEEAEVLFEKIKAERRRQLQKCFKSLSSLYLKKPAEPNWVNIFETDIKYSKVIEQLVSNSWQYWVYGNIEYKNIFLPELIKRAVNKIKPFSQNGQEFRDAILWLSILDYMKFLRDERYDEEFVFITLNTRDFGNNGLKELNESLKSELETQNLKLDTFFSIEDFMLKHMNYTIPFTNGWIFSNLDWKKIRKEVNRAVRGIHCSYYFTLFERSSIEDLENYEVTLVKINRQEVEYYAYEKIDKTILLEIHFSGEVFINFYTESGKTIPIKTYFHTQTSAKATQNRIFHYSGEYFEEESGLMLPELPKQNQSA